jgi:hypothetical protein
MCFARVGSSYFTSDTSRVTFATNMGDNSWMRQGRIDCGYDKPNTYEDICTCLENLTTGPQQTYAKIFKIL